MLHIHTKCSFYNTDVSVDFLPRWHVFWHILSEKSIVNCRPNITPVFFGGGKFIFHLYFKPEIYGWENKACLAVCWEGTYSRNLHKYNLKHKYVDRTAEKLVMGGFFADSGVTCQESRREFAKLSFLCPGRHLAANVKNRDCLKNSDSFTLSTSANYSLEHNHTLLWKRKDNVLMSVPEISATEFGYFMPSENILKCFPNI